MPAALPQTIADSLFDKLAPSIEKGENLLDEFEVHSIIRDAKKIPSEFESLAIQGLAWLVLGNLKKGCELCESAISLNPYASALWGNYAVCVGQRKYHALQREILKRSVDIRSPALLVFDFIVASFWADYDEMARVKSIFKSLDLATLTQKQQKDYINAEAIYNTLDSISEKERKSLAEMANLVMEMMFEYKLKARNSDRYIAPDGTISFNYDVFDVSAGFIVQLNDELASKIVEHRLHNAESIVLFTPGD